MGRPKVAARVAALLGQDESLLLGLQALADPVRLRMVRLLAEREQCVCRLTEALGLTQASISHHVAVLKRAGLVEDRRDTRWTYYRLAPDAASLLRSSIEELLDFTRADSIPADCCGPAESGSYSSATAAKTLAPQSQVSPVICAGATYSRES